MPLQPRKTKVSRLALCIGAGYYEHFTGLKTPVKDAIAVAERLLDSRIGNFDRVILLVDNFEKELKPGDGLPSILLPDTTSIPTLTVDRTRISGAITRIFENYKFENGSLVVFFFAGHGAPNNVGELFLFGSDGCLTQHRHPDFNTGLNLNSTFSEFLSRKTGPQNTVILLDTCYAGTATNLAHKLQPFAKSRDEKLHQIYLIGGAQSNKTAGAAGDYGYFTACLLASFNQYPLNGWITMSRIQEYISNNLPVSSNGKGQQIEGVNHFGDNIKLVKNPTYDPQSAAFSEEVQRYLMLDGWTVNPIVSGSEKPISFFQAKIDEGLLRKDNLAVYCLDNGVVDVWPSLVERVALYLKNIPQVEKRLLVTRYPLTPDLAQTATSTCPSLLLTTSAELLKENMDFSEYERELIRLYEKGDQQPNKVWRVPPLGEVYLPLIGYAEPFIQTNQILEELSRVDFTESEKEESQEAWQGDLQEGILNWLNNENIQDNRAVLTGTYGTGKSSFCLHLAVFLIKSGHPRKPILINLADFAGRVKPNFQGFLEDFLKKKGVSKVTAPKLSKWAEAGLLFFIFDGFDEMASRSVDKVKETNLDYIMEWTEKPGNKVLITTRPEFFLTRQEEIELLSSFHRFYCSLLTGSQVDKYLENRVNWHIQHRRRRDEQVLTWQDYRTKIDSTYDLSDLQHRFVLLELIIKNIPKYIEQDKQEISRADLYQDYLNQELEERLVEYEGIELVRQLATSDRLNLLEELAFRLYQDKERTNEGKFSGEEAEQWLESYMSRTVKLALRNNWTNFLTYSFLVPAGEDLFEFSHTSFLEYLVALHLTKQLTNDDFSGIALRPLSKEIADFLAEMNPPTEALIAAADVTQAEDNLVYGAGQVLLSRRLYLLNRRLLVSKSFQSAVIDSSYITCLEYQVFIIEKIKDNAFYYPDHWTTIRFTPSMARRPIIGIRDTDASSFCGWLNKRIANRENGTEVNQIDYSQAFFYCLPASTELTPLNDYPYLAAWCNEGYIYKLDELFPIAIDLTVSRLAKIENPYDLLPAQYNSLSFHPIFGLEPVFGAALNIALDLDPDRTSDYLIDLIVEHEHFYKYEYSYAFGYIKNFRNITNKLLDDVLTKKILPKIEIILEELKNNDKSPLTDHRLNFLSRLIDMGNAKNIEEYRQAQRELAKEYALLVYAGLEKKEEAAGENYWEEKKYAGRIYWAQKIIEARRNNPDFPNWESLRIVCARPNN